MLIQDSLQPTTTTISPHNGPRLFFYVFPFSSTNSVFPFIYSLQTSETTMPPGTEGKGRERRQGQGLEMHLVTTPFILFMLLPTTSVIFFLLQ